MSPGVEACDIARPSLLRTKLAKLGNTLSLLVPLNKNSHIKALATVAGLEFPELVQVLIVDT